MPNQDSSRRKLAVDLAELEMAFEDASEFASHFLDLETGQVIMITEETRWSYEEINQNLEDAEDFEQALQECDLHDWQRDTLRETNQVEMGYGTRYVRVPQIESHEAYRDMEDFIDTVASERLQERLWDAIRGQGAFRRFKDMLSHYPREREQWFRFRDARTRQRVLDWMESLGIEPVMKESAAAPHASSGPSPRSRPMDGSPNKNNLEPENESAQAH